MNIHFEYEFKDTEKFERCYEEELQIPRDLRKDIINNGLVVYLCSEKGLVGESYGATPHQLNWLDDEDQIEDVIPYDDESIYVYSTTILPQFQGQGYGKVLVEEFAKHASDNGYVKLVGHTTTPVMKRIREQQGAIFRTEAVHEKWYDTDRTAHFYTQFLTQNKEYNCGPVALAYLLENKGFSFFVESLERELKTDPEEGTSPTNIEFFFQSYNIPYKIISELHPNSIIDITVHTAEGTDGHWIVLIEPVEDGWRVYDPAVGICIDKSDLVSQWISPRYGKSKGFQLI